jgi:hypothetical protein
MRALMLWLQPAAWLGLVAVAAPVLIHLLVHRRSERLDFPSIQFLQPTRFASMRRHVLGDLALLAVRVAILAVAVAALAGPLLTTMARRASWNARVARAIVIDPREPGRAARMELAQRESTAAFRATVIESPDVAGGLHRAVAWLDTAPPARREIVCLSPLSIGTITAAVVSTVPRDIGLRFIRSGSLAATRTIPGAPVLTWAEPRTDGREASTPSGQPTVRDRRVTLNGRDTLVVDGAASPAALPIDVLAPANAQPIVHAAVRAVLQEHVSSPPADRRATLLIAGAQDDVRIRASAEAIHSPWVGDAVARIIGDRDVAAVAAEVREPASNADTRRGPWQVIASGANNQPIVVAAQSGSRLLVVSAAAPSDLLTPVLIRSILSGLSDPATHEADEILPIQDVQLRAWERLPGPAAMPEPRGRIDDVNDDRRWLWAAALILIALEGWMRSRPRVSAGVSLADQEDQRVA